MWDGTTVSPGFHLTSFAEYTDCVVSHHLGEVEIQVDGATVINATGLMLRSSESCHVQGVHFETFFGGEYSLTSVGTE